MNTSSHPKRALLSCLTLLVTALLVLSVFTIGLAIYMALFAG